MIETFLNEFKPEDPVDLILYLADNQFGLIDGFEINRRYD
jgi:hypothetical protein